METTTTKQSDAARVVRVERREGGVAQVTLDRPAAKNALSRAVNLELVRITDELGADPSVRVILLTGAGDAFCAGADLVERRGITAAESAPYIEAIGGAIHGWAKMPRPTVALINGAALGGGLELALACDFRIAATGAILGLSEVRLGIMPGAGGTQRLARLIGVARAKELVLTGRRIDAARALEIGLVGRVVAPDQLARAGDELAAELAACAPLSVSMAKRAIDQGADLPLEEGLRVERSCYDVTLFSEDRNEGLRAFAEKRPPRFSGR